MLRNLELRDKHYLFFILVAALFFFNGMFFNPGLSYASRDSLDIYAFEYQHRYATFNTLNQIAFWNPYLYGGLPFFPGVSIFYPFNALFLLSNSFLLLNFYQLFHVLLAGLLMYTFARLLRLNSFCSFVTALAFMFGGNLLTKVGGAYPQLASYSLMPLVFILLELLLLRGRFFYAVLFGSGLGLLFLAGHQQYFYMISLALLLYFVLRVIAVSKWKRCILYFVIAYVVGLLLASVAVLPVLEFGSYISRLDGGIKGAGYSYVSSGSLPLKQLTNFIMPNLYGNGWALLENGLTTYWGAPTYNELYVYMGLIPLFLVLFATKTPRKIWHFLVLALFGLVYALGASTPLFNLVLLIPGADLFRTPARMLMVVSFCFAVMAGYGMEYLLRKNKPLGKPSQIFGVILTFLFILFTLLVFLFKSYILNVGEKILNHLYYAVYANSIFVQTHSFESLLGLLDKAYAAAAYSIWWFTLFFIMVIILSFVVNRSKAVFKFLIVTLLIADLFVFNSPLLEGSDLSSFLKETEIIDFLKEAKETNALFRAVATEPSLFRQYFAQKYNIHNLLGSGSSRIKYFDAFVEKGLGIVDDVHAQIKWGELVIPAERMETDYISKLLGMWNIRYIISREPLHNPDFKAVFEAVDGIVYANSMVLPRAYVVGSAKVVSSNLIFDEMQSSAFDPHKIVLFDDGVPYPLNNEGFFKEANVTNYTPNEIVVKVSLQTPGFLVLADSWYPGWVAYDNCIKKEVYRANYAMRAVYLDKGLHIVKFRREPTYLYASLIVSSLTAAFVAVYLLLYGIGKWWKKASQKN